MSGRAQSRPNYHTLQFSILVYLERRRKVRTDKSRNFMSLIISNLSIEIDMSLTTDL